jgi:hypothetical protein
MQKQNNISLNNQNKYLLNNEVDKLNNTDEGNHIDRLVELRERNLGRYKPKPKPNRNIQQMPQALNNVETTENTKLNDLNNIKDNNNTNINNPRPGGSDMNSGFNNTDIDPSYNNSGNNNINTNPYNTGNNVGTVGSDISAVDNKPNNNLSNNVNNPLNNQGNNQNNNTNDNLRNNLNSNLNNNQVNNLSNNVNYPLNNQGNNQNNNTNDNLRNNLNSNLNNNQVNTPNSNFGNNNGINNTGINNSEFNNPGINNNLNNTNDLPIPTPNKAINRMANTELPNNNDKENLQSLQTENYAPEGNNPNKELYYNNNSYNGSNQPTINGAESLDVDEKNKLFGGKFNKTKNANKNVLLDVMAFSENMLATNQMIKPTVPEMQTNNFERNKIEEIEPERRHSTEANSLQENKAQIENPDTNRELIEQNNGAIPEIVKTTMLIVKKDIPLTNKSNYISCNNVTTEYFDRLTNFSYLTNPVSRKDLLVFIIKNQDHRFVLQEKFNEGDLQKLTFKMLKNFLFEINSHCNLLSQLERLKARSLYIKTLFIIISILVILTGPILYFIFNETPDAPTQSWDFIMAISILSAIVFVGFILLLLSCCIFKTNKQIETKFFMGKFEEYKHIIDKWNSRFFVHMGVFCTTVRNLNYFQLTPVEVELFVEPHPRPKKGVSFVNDLVEPQSNIGYSYESLKEYNIIY